VGKIKRASDSVSGACQGFQVFPCKIEGRNLVLSPARKVLQLTNEAISFSEGTFFGLLVAVEVVPGRGTFTKANPATESKVVPETLKEELIPFRAT
jgi:hypothetical protein